MIGISPPSGLQLWLLAEGSRGDTDIIGNSEIMDGAVLAYFNESILSFIRNLYFLKDSKLYYYCYYYYWQINNLIPQIIIVNRKSE